MDQRRRHVLRGRSLGALVALAGALLLSPTRASAEPAGAAQLFPVVAEDLRDEALKKKARELDGVLHEAAQDLELDVQVGATAPFPPAREDELVRGAEGSAAWQVSARISRDGDAFLLRLSAARPGSRVVLVRVERVEEKSLTVRAVVMLRDLVQAARAKPEEPKAKEKPEPKEPHVRSEGRAVLAGNSAAYGAFLGLSLYESSRGDDSRLAYPLMALGTGIGLGASLIAADEWDVTKGDARYIAAGTWWPAAATALLTAGYDTKPSSDRYAFAATAGAAGTGLAAVRLARGSVSEGGAVATHSGALAGGFVGGMTELFVRGESSRTPYKGAGYGVGAGVLVMGIVGPMLKVEENRVLMVDLGLGLGALLGAAAGSPLLVRDASKTQRRGWAAATVAGGGIGAVLAGIATRPDTAKLPFSPGFGLVATGPRGEPVYGVTASGVLAW